MLTCVPWVKIISIRGVRFRFWCWTRLSMLKKVPELAWTTVNFYSSWESVSQTSGIKLNTIKRSLCPVNCSHLVRFCQLLQIGSTMFHFLSVRGVPLKEKLHPMHKDAFLNRELSFGELSPMVGPSFWWFSMGSQFDSLFISQQEKSFMLSRNIV